MFKMDPETARNLYLEGAILVCLNVPEETQFGIDFKTWITDKKFRGIKMIPPGAHYIFFNEKNDVDSAPRLGFFHYFHKGEIIVKRWNQIEETISIENVSGNVVERLKDCIQELDKVLAPYPFNIYNKWQLYNEHINKDIIQQLSPECGLINSVLELQPCSDADRPRGSDPDSNKKINILPDLKPVEGKALKLTQLPEKNYPDSATPSEITQHSLDSTYVLEYLLKKYKNHTDIIGEIQYCFVCFLIGHSLEAFEQWKKLITVFCSAYKALEKYQSLYSLLVHLLDIDIKEIPEDFFVDIVANNNVIYTNIKNLYRNLKHSSVSGHLIDDFQTLLKNLNDLFKWDFNNIESDEEDEAPVVVKL